MSQNMYDPRSPQELEQLYQNLLAEKQALRRDERMIAARERGRGMGSLPDQLADGDAARLKKNMERFLPAHLVPGNVGPLYGTSWFFFQSVAFDFGVAPTILPSTSQTSSFQVTQEAAFIVMAISRTAPPTATGGGLGPWQIKLVDRQSSRQLNDRPIPLQAIGTESMPTVLPSPYLIMPNAFIDVTMSTWITAPLGQLLAGPTTHEIAFYGYRVRLENATELLSTIYG